MGHKQVYTGERGKAHNQGPVGQQHHIRQDVQEQPPRITQVAAGAWDGRREDVG